MTQQLAPEVIQCLFWKNKWTHNLLRYIIFGLNALLMQVTWWGDIYFLWLRQLLPRIFYECSNNYSKIISKFTELRDAETHKAIRVWGWINTLTYIRLIGEKIYNFILMKYFSPVILSKLGNICNIFISIFPLRLWLFEKSIGNLCHAYLLAK